MNEKSNLPECERRVEMAGGRTNICVGNEPYSCQRMFRDFGCPLGKKLKESKKEKDIFDKTCGSCRESGCPFSE